MTQLHECDSCGNTQPDKYLLYIWIRSEDERPDFPFGPASGDRLDFCSWRCIQNYAFLKVAEASL